MYEILYIVVDEIPPRILQTTKQGLMLLTKMWMACKMCDYWKMLSVKVARGVEVSYEEPFKIFLQEESML